MRYGMMIETDKCVGCQACVASCKERWDSGKGASRDWVREILLGKRGKDLSLTFFPGLCNHCKDNPCTTVCPTGATYADAKGIVQVDNDVCIGCGNCISACPYGARTPDDEKQVVEKCTFCAPYVAKGEQPACVQTCLAECRHFGDTDDPNSAVSKLIKERGAKPLVTKELDIGPNVYYAPEIGRQRILKDEKTIKELDPSLLTTVWQKATRPVARYAVPPIIALTGLGGLMINLRTRKERAAGHGHDDGGAEGEAARPAKLYRHKPGMRFLHWFNALSWILLVLTGTGLMLKPSFALFGEGFAQGVSNLFGGQASMLRFHVLWGLLWAFIIVPFFLVFKKGGIEALKEIMITRDDIKWMMLKPWVMLGLTEQKLPPQDKYNAGQKLFAASALAGTTLIIASGFVMTFHLGSADWVRAAILVHKLAIMIALVGVAVHVTMAAIIAEERPALKSMVTGYVDRSHAASHSTKWLEEVECESSEGAQGDAPAQEGE